MMLGRPILPPPSVLMLEMSRRRKDAPIGIGDRDDIPALSAIAARLEPVLRRRFERAVLNTQARLELERLAEAIRAGSITQVEELARLDLFRGEVEEAFAGTLQSGFLRGAEFAHVQLQNIGLGLNFDLINPYAIAFASRHVPQLAEDLTQTMGQNVRRLLPESFEHGIPPRTLARKIRDVIGLTERALAQVNRLEQRLRDRGVAEDDIAVQRGKLTAALLRRRSITIARTELIRAHNEGQHSLWTEAKTQGLLDPSRTRREWIAAMDDRLDIDICLPLDGQRVEMDQPFEVNGIQYDKPPAHPNCRCSVGLVFVEAPAPTPSVSGGDVIPGDPRVFHGTVTPDGALSIRPGTASEEGESAFTGWLNSSMVRSTVLRHLGVDPESIPESGRVRWTYLDSKRHPNEEIRNFFDTHPDTAGLADWNDTITFWKSAGDRLLAFVGAPVDSRVNMVKEGIATLRSIHSLTHEWMHMQAPERTSAAYVTKLQKDIEEGVNELIAQRALPAMVSMMTGKAVTLPKYVHLAYAYPVQTSVIHQLLNAATGVPLDALKQELGAPQIQLLVRFRFLTPTMKLVDTVVNAVGDRFAWSLDQRDEFRRLLDVSVFPGYTSVSEAIQQVNMLKGSHTEREKTMTMKQGSISPRDLEIVRLLHQLTAQNHEDIARQIERLIAEAESEEERRRLGWYLEMLIMSRLAFQQISRS